MSKLSTLTFRGATLRYCDIRRKEESMPFVRLHLSADVSSTVCAEMKWQIGEGVTSGNLASRLSCSHLILSPNDKALKQHEMQIEIMEVSDFKFVAPGADPEEGAVASPQLRFIARSNQADAAARVEQYWRAVGAADAQMRLAYQREPQQQSLLASNAGEKLKAAEEPAPPIVADEFSDADKPGSPALASATEMSRKHGEAEKRARKGVQ